MTRHVNDSVYKTGKVITWQSFSSSSRDQLVASGCEAMSGAIAAVAEGSVQVGVVGK